MTERSIVEAATRLRRQGEPYLVATVVRVQGAGYRSPGARMLLTRFRWIAGAISGGSLEGDLASDAWRETRDGSALLLTYPSGEGCGDDDLRIAFGLGCDGTVDVLVERAGVTGRIDPLAIADESLRAQRRAAIATVFRSAAPTVAAGTRMALVAGGALASDAAPLDAATCDAIAADLATAIETGVSCNRSYATAGGAIDVLIEAVIPPPRLFLCGAGHDAVPVAELARTLGWDVVVCPADARHATRERFPMAESVLAEELAARIAASDRAVAVVMHHELARDRESLARLLATDVRFVGVLGPRARVDRLLGELGAADARVHAVGHAHGGESVQEAALAIISELQAAISGPVRGRRLSLVA